MVKSTRAASPRSEPKICEASGAAISSPASESGTTPYASPDCPMTDLFGREVAPAPVSAPQEKAQGLMTLVTSGLIGRDSSASAALQRSLESRLVQRLDTAGSTLFRLTRRNRTTPLGRRYWERAASGRRTLDKDFTSWPSPQAHDERKRGNTEADHHYFPHDLSNAVEMASWPTPTGKDSQCAGSRAKGSATPEATNRIRPPETMKKTAQQRLERCGQTTTPLYMAEQ